MTMSHDGLAKLIEECGELIQVAGKLLAYPNGKHPDGAGCLHLRLEAELADVAAASSFVIGHYHLDEDHIESRTVAKFLQYAAWHHDPNN